VLPSHQRLYPGDLIALERHDGLVVDPELFPCEGSPEPGLQRQALHRLGIHAGLEHLVASLASMFGSVHRQVRMSQEIRRPLMSGVAEGDPGADGGEYLMFSKSKGMLQSLRDPLRYLYSLTYTRDVFNQDSKLVPAKARGGIFGTQASLQTLGDRHEQLVSYFVPKAVVYDLEAVEIREQHRELATSPIGTS
jgi:hypothetical protein